MGNTSDTRMLLTPAQAADKIAAIVDTRKPHFQYNLAIDAKLVNSFVTRWLPFRARAAINRRMYRLNKPMVWPQLATAAS
jgi:hypothetical protein